MKLLIFGDVFGKLGRAGVKMILPKWRKKFSPDVVIANVENIAHGKGIGIKQISELQDAGVNIFTGGNHSLEGKNFAEVLNDETLPILRPANMPDGTPGRGVLLYNLAAPGKTSDVFGDSTSDVEEGAAMKLLVINLIGQVNMKQTYDSPFDAVDKILAEYGDTTPYKILDWHAEATSEKTVMGWYLDGKVSAVFGTHSHVPTADAKILPKGTAYISDIGMVGPYHSVIGAELEPAIQRFKTGVKTPIQPVESGPIEINGLYLELDEKGLGVDIRHLREIIPEDKIEE